MSSLSSGLNARLNALIATVLRSHPSLRMLPISRYTQDHAAVYATANGRAIAHEVDAEGRQSLLVALDGGWTMSASATWSTTCTCPATSRCRC